MLQEEEVEGQRVTDAPPLILTLVERQGSPLTATVPVSGSYTTLCTPKYAQGLALTVFPSVRSTTGPRYTLHSKPRTRSLTVFPLQTTYLAVFVPGLLNRYTTLALQTK